MPSIKSFSPRRRILPLLGAAAAGLWAAVPAGADEAVIEALSPRILFSISGGYWETLPETEQTDTDEADADEAAPASPDAAADEPSERGYYRAVAYRSEDNSSRLYLQKIGLSDGAPVVLETDEIEEIASEPAFITDLRPENSTGISATTGFAAFIYLKRDPADAQPENWELFVDEFGELTVNEATN
jgi:hypothetical protein